MKTILLALILALFPLEAIAADYYVTQDGAGLKNGTLGNSWSIDIYRTKSFVGNDTVKFSGVINSQVILASGGSSATDKVTYNFSGATLTLNTSQRVQIAASHINVFGGTMGPAPNLFQTQIYTSFITVSDVVISGWTSDAGNGASSMFCAFESGSTISDVVIENNTVDNVMRFVASYGSANGLTVRNNYARSTTAGGSPNTNGLQVDLIFLAGARSVTIEGNKLINRSPGEAANNHADVIQGYAATQSPHGWVIRNNWIEIAVTSGSDGSNQFTSLEGWTANSDALKAYGNVFVGDASGATNGLNVSFQVGANARIYVYNNTFIRRLSPSFTLRADSANIDLYLANNLFWASSPVGGTFYLGLAEEVQDWNPNFGFNIQDCDARVSGAAGSCTTDPKLTPTFALAADSTLRGKGINLGSEYSMAVANDAVWPNPKLVSRGTSWDVGAYQSGSTPTEPIPVPPDPMNTPPVVSLLQIKNGSTVLDPTLPITLKNITIATAASDDTGLTLLQISVRGQILKTAVPNANPTTMTTPWNTNPYRGKGPVTIEVLGKDADNVETRRSITVTVKR